MSKRVKIKIEILLVCLWIIARKMYVNNNVSLDDIDLTL